METPGCSPPLRVRCPHCMQLTNHIQAYDIPFVMFALFYVAWDWRGHRVFGCPPCVRQQLRRAALMSLVVANVVCWIPLPTIIQHINTSYADTQPTIPPEYESLANLKPQAGDVRRREEAARRKRLVIILVLFAVILACLMFLLPALSAGQ